MHDLCMESWSFSLLDRFCRLFSFFSVIYKNHLHNLTFENYSHVGVLLGGEGVGGTEKHLIMSHRFWNALLKLLVSLHQKLY